MNKKDMETLIIQALHENDLSTLGDENGVEIDSQGPTKGNSTYIEGMHTRSDGTRAFFSATLTVSLDEYVVHYSDEEYDEED